MHNARKIVEKALVDAGFEPAARAQDDHAGFAGPGFCTQRWGNKILVGYIGPDGEAAGGEEARTHLSAYAAVLAGAGFAVDRVSGAYPCLSISLDRSLERDAA